MDLGCCTGKRACLILLCVQNTHLRPILDFHFSGVIVSVLELHIPHLHSFSVSKASHPPLLSRDRHTEVIRALLEYDVSSFTYKKFEFLVCSVS